MLFTLKPRLKVSLISLILIFSLTGVSQAHDHHSYVREDGKQVDNPNWMSILPDGILLSQLSIPGTHQSLSRHSDGITPLDAVKNQSMALRFQLESGIRVLDVRCAVDKKTKNSFDIYHGAYYQKENFGGVLDTVVQFLKDHPSETVLMRVKNEHTSDPEKFREIFLNTYWNNDKYRDFIPMKMPRNPTLGEMRGKIVILQDFARWQCLTPTSTAEFGICYSTFEIQDSFKHQGYAKWVSVKTYLDRANKGFDEGPNWGTKYINYLSAEGAGSDWIPRPWFVASGHVNPRTDADRQWAGNRNRNEWPDFPRIPDNRGRKRIYYEGMNTLTYDFIRNGHFTKRVGIIMADFPGGGLIERIICINYEKPTPMCQRLPPCEGPLCR
ncbi:MAG: phosphatidylinositol-specific phospholipase C [Pyrinomonadaceae bacterium]